MCIEFSMQDNVFNMFYLQYDMVIAAKRLSMAEAQVIHAERTETDYQRPDIIINVGKCLTAHRCDFMLS
jgi:hypothetical protein